MATRTAAQGVAALDDALADVSALGVVEAHELWPAAKNADAFQDVDALWQELQSAWSSRGSTGVELVVRRSPP